MKVKPKKCKNCAKLFTPQRSSLEVVCSSNCAIELNKPKLLVKGSKEFKEVKTEVKIGENRTELQRNINLLSRMIDARFGFDTCIDCRKPMNKQIHGAHFHNVKGHEHLRFNLHNIHSALSQCNKYSSEHKVGYKAGHPSYYKQYYISKENKSQAEKLLKKINNYCN